MKSNPLDEIVKCTVEISAPAVNEATFSTILMIVPPPAAAGTRAITKAFPIISADELLDYGYTVEDGAYRAAEAAFSQNPCPEDIRICVRKKITRLVENLDDDVDEVFGDDDEPTPGGGGTPTVETIEEWENIKDTLARAYNETAFYGVYLCDFRESADIQAAMEWVEAHEKIFGCEYMDIAACPIRNFTYYRTFVMFTGAADGFGADEQPKTNEYGAVAWMAKCFGYEPGSETWALKPLATLVPSLLSTAEKNELTTMHINTFRRYAGDNITFGGFMTAGEWIDVIRFRDWVKNEMQVNVFNVLKVNRKVPFTDNGIGLIEGAMKKTLSVAQQVGGIAPTEYDADGNAIPGWTVTVPRALDLTEVQRKSRKLTGCKWTARLAGAIHAVEIYGYLTF